MEPLYSEPFALPLTPLPKDMPSPTEPLTVHGSGLTVQAFFETRSRERETGWLQWIMGALLLIFGFAAASIAMGYVGYVEGMFLLALLGVTLLAVLLGANQRKNARGARLAREARLYAAAVAGGVTTTVYPDRIEQRSSRMKWVVPFTDTSVFVENRDWFLVETDGVQAVVAASDVTPWEAQTMYEMIARAIPPERQFGGEQFAARRASSSPPPFSVTPPICYERVEYREESDGEFEWPAGLSWWLFAVTLGVSGMFTSLFQMTPFFFLDYLIVFTACFVGLLIGTVAVLQYKRHHAEEDVAISFTSEGLLIERDGGQCFVCSADVHAARTENGVELFTPAGTFTVPWTATKNRQQLEWMLFSQRPSSF